ncbi:MAG: hypothetical protein ABTQ25_08250 [Nitrosomonas ureae]
MGWISIKAFSTQCGHGKIERSANGLPEQAQLTAPAMKRQRQIGVLPVIWRSAQH